MANQWFKFYGSEYLGDPKMLALTGNERSCWITLLSYASISDPEGTVRHLAEYQLMSQSGIDPTNGDWGETKGVLEKFKSLDMITLDNGVIVIKNWEKRQERALTGYERVKRYRENHKDDNGDNDLDNTRIEENRRDKKRIEKKDTYGEFKKVLLTSEEYEKLVKALGEKNSLLLIGELDNYIASKGKRYASHYATVLNWARRRIVDHQNKPVKGKGIV